MRDWFDIRVLKDGDGEGAGNGDMLLRWGYYSE